MLYLLIGLCVLLAAWRWFQMSDPTQPPVWPGKLPLLGHGLMFLGDSVKMFDNVKEISMVGNKTSGSIRIYFGPRLFYCVMDPEDSLKVSTACIHKHYIYNFGRPFLGNGILNADVPTWKKHRKLLNPAFSQQVFDGFIETFNYQGLSLVERFKGEVGKPFDHEKHLRINNLETICATSFGVTPAEFGNLKQEYLPLLEEALHIINVRIQTFWFHDEFLFNLSSLKKRQDDVVSRLNEITTEIIRKYKAEKNDSTNCDDNLGKFRPFIDLIIELAKDNPSLTEQQILGESSTIIAGGHDTTASALTFALTLLGSHPEVQEKAYKEILEIVGDSERIIDKEDLSKLVYIEAIVKETIRLYPSVPIVARALDQDIKIKNYILKAGASCVVSLYGVNRHPIWGPDADKFRPERWFEKDSLPDSKYFASFGLARRTCIGKTYAMISMKILLAHVLRRFTITSDISKLVVKMDTMIRPEEGHHIALQNRD